MSRLFHGTTLANWESIQSRTHGWGVEGIANWNCSIPGEVYFHDPSKDADSCPINSAFESAQIAAAVQNFSGSTLVVIELEIEECLIGEDLSCENMNDISSTVDGCDIEPHHVVAVYACECYLPSLRLLYVAGLLSTNDYIAQYEFSELELTVADSLKEIFLDELMEFDWSELS